MKNKKRIIALLIVAMMLCVNISSAFAVRTTGTIDGYEYRITLSGNTVRVDGSTFYSKPMCSRSINITGTYISANFIGTKTATGSMGGGNGEVSAFAVVPSEATDRFLNASAIHKMDGWTKTTSVILK